MLHIFIISCPSLINSRLSSIRKIFTSVARAAELSTVTVLREPDEYYCHSYFLNYHYDYGSWDSHIQFCSDEFLSNINHSAFNHLNNTVMSSREMLCTLFPPRRLSISEISISLRHRWIWKHCRKLDGITLVLEDDALIGNPGRFRELLSHLWKIHGLFPYVDYSDNSVVPYPKPSYLYQLEGFELYSLPIAKTRTLLCYSFSNKVMQSVLSNDTCQSLPIDMHLQYLLKKANMAGCVVSHSSLIHGSKVSLHQSAISS
jgi:hypothetical protein